MTTPTIDPHPPNRDRKTLEEALDAFKRATGLPTNLVAFAKQATPDHRADAVIELGKEEHRVTLFAEIKTVERATMLATLKGHLDRHDGQGLLVTPYLTAELANHCRKMDLQRYDGSLSTRAATTNLCTALRSSSKTPMTSRLTMWK